VSNKSDWRASAQWFYDGNGTAPEEFGGEPNFCAHSQIICLIFVLKIYATRCQYREITGRNNEYRNTAT